MKWHWSLLIVALGASPALAQEMSRPPTGSDGAVLLAPEGNGAVPVADFTAGAPNGCATGDHGFPNFIGFVSNVELAIDPRALSQMWPVFGNTWTSQFGRVPSGDVQVYGAGLSVALSDRLCLGLSKGGYLVAHFRGERDGFLNLGGYLQYTVIRDTDSQFLVTAGLGWEAPTGEAEVGQGHGPAYLNPYITAGKEIGNFHVLGTFGYDFPTGTDTVTNNTFYGTLHLDRKCGWLYPLVEFNFAFQEKNVNIDPSSRPGFFDFVSNLNAAGNIVTVAPGLNAVLVPDRVELGAVYQTPIYSKRNLRFNEVLMKMIYRF